MHCLFFLKNDPEDESNLPGVRPYPEVNTALFKTSAAKAIKLMDDAKLVMKKITSSPSFSNQLMTAAQQSHQLRVEELIQSAGIKKIPDITFSPDGITMNFKDYAGNQECCHIILQLRWV